VSDPSTAHQDAYSINDFSNAFDCFFVFLRAQISQPLPEIDPLTKRFVHPETPCEK